MFGGSTFLCLLAAAFFWACNAIQITQIAQQSPKWKNLDKEVFMQLLPDNIANEWNMKLDAQALEYASGFLKGAFWVTVSLPIVQMAWVLSKRGTHSMPCNVGIIIFTLAGCWSKWFSAIFWNGIYLSLTTLAANFNLDEWLSSEQTASFGIDGEDGIGFRVLEVNYLVFRGLVLIVNAVEWLCLFVIFILTFMSVLEWRKEDTTSFGGKWNALGLFIGLLAGIQFVLEIVGVEGVGLAWLFFILYSALNRLVLIPLWIITLGFQLPIATSKEFNYVNELELQEQTPLTRPSNFTIDEDDNDGQPPPGPSTPPAEAFATVQVT
jgi:hypothetical protein